MDRWIGKVAVVTGAASGIGNAVYHALGLAGLQVVGLDIKTDSANIEKTKECKGIRHCDVSKIEDVEKAFEFIEHTFGLIHVLVNCAGVLYQGQITDVGNNPLSTKQLIDTLDINLKGSILNARFAANHMNKNTIDGHIININSLAGHYVPLSSSMNLYASTKYGITAFSEALSQELSHFSSRIKITSLSPGVTATNMASHMADVPALLPSDVADAVLYVLSTPPHINVKNI